METGGCDALFYCTSETAFHQGNQENDFHWKVKYKTSHAGFMSFLCVIFYGISHSACLISNTINPVNYSQ